MKIIANKKTTPQPTKQTNRGTTILRGATILSSATVQSYKGPDFVSESIKYQYSRAKYTGDENVNVNVNEMTLF